MSTKSVDEKYEFNGYYHDEPMSQTVYAWIKALEKSEKIQADQIAFLKSQVTKLKEALKAECYCAEIFICDPCRNLAKIEKDGLK